MLFSYCRCCSWLPAGAATRLTTPVTTGSLVMLSGLPRYMMLLRQRLLLPRHNIPRETNGKSIAIGASSRLF